MKKLIFLTIILTHFFSAYPAPCFAMGGRPRQRTVASIEGRVTDNRTNQGISGASLNLYGATGQRLASVVTDNQGNYFLSGEFTGPHILRIEAEGYAGASESILLRGSGANYFDFSLNPPGGINPVNITSFSPPDRSSLTCGDTLTLSIEASNSGRGRLEYKFLMDSNTIRDWNTSNRHTFRLTDSDRGRHKITVEAKNNRGATDSKEFDIYIFRQFPKPNN